MEVTDRCYICMLYFYSVICLFSMLNASVGQENPSVFLVSLNFAVVLTDYVSADLISIVVSTKKRLFNRKQEQVK